MDLKKGIKALNTVIHECVKEKQDAVVAIADQSGDLVAFAKTDNAPSAFIQLTINKAYTAARVKQETNEFGKDLASGRYQDINLFSDDKLNDKSGGFPIFDEEGKIIGAIGVSCGSAEIEKELAHKAIESITPKPSKNKDKFKLYS